MHELRKAESDEKAELEKSLSDIQPHLDRLKGAIQRVPEALAAIANKDCSPQELENALSLLRDLNELNAIMDKSQHCKPSLSWVPYLVIKSLHIAHVLITMQDTNER